MGLSLHSGFDYRVFWTGKAPLAGGDARLYPRRNLADAYPSAKFYSPFGLC